MRKIKLADHRIVSLQNVEKCSLTNLGVALPPELSAIRRAPRPRYRGANLSREDAKLHFRNRCVQALCSIETAGQGTADALALAWLKEQGFIRDASAPGSATITRHGLIWAQSLLDDFFGGAE